MIRILTRMAPPVMWLMTLLVVTGSATVLADAPLTAAAITPDGQQVLLGSQQGIEIRSWPALTVIGHLATDLVHVHDLRFAPDGRTLLAAGGAPAVSGRMEVWSWPDARRVRNVNGHDDVVYRVAWSPDATQWVSGSGDGRCLVFSAADAADAAQPVQQLPYQGHSRAVLAVGWLDSERVVSAGVDQTVRLWSSGDAAHKRTLDNHVGSVNDLAVQPGPVGERGPQMATVSEDRTVRLWQPAIGRLVRFTRLASIPRCLAWTPDGQSVVVGCQDGRIRMIHAQDMTITRELDGLPGRIHELVVHPDGRELLVAGETGCRRVTLRSSDEAVQAPTQGSAPPESR